jgi:hypothetical protein
MNNSISYDHPTTTILFLTRDIVSKHFYKQKIHKKAEKLQTFVRHIGIFIYIYYLKYTASCYDKTAGVAYLKGK